MDPFQDYIVLKALKGHEPPQLNALQSFAEPHVQTFETLWFLIWCITACIVALKLWSEYRKGGR